MSDEKKIAHNEICRNCLKWEKFGEDCRVHWIGKKECSMRVETPEDWEAEMQMLRK